jgi:Zn-dependent oligopeptidase
MLFKRVQASTESEQALDPEALQLLKEIHQSFVRAGAHLPEPARKRVNASSYFAVSVLSWPFQERLTRRETTLQRYSHPLLIMKS